MPEINFRSGSAARRFFRGTVTLAAGTGTVATGFNTVDSVMISQADATAVADGVSWSASGGTVTVDSSDGASTETYHVWVIGF